MTLVIDDVKKKNQLHALVIGVGAYPHLIDGSLWNTAPANDSYGLGQLSSPPRSAADFADWLIQGYHHPKVPLGSLDLLICDTAGPVDYTDRATGAVHAVAAPDKAAIKAAIKSWKKRGDTRADNMMLLYFCGHGLSKSAELSMLASDFGDPAENTFENAIDLDAIMQGMERCKANNQLYFIDACRNEPNVLLNQTQLGDRQILNLNVQIPAGYRPRQALFFATARDDKAHSLKGKPSRFTEALLCGLKGAGARQPSTKWIVTTLYLAGSIASALKLGNRLDGTPFQESDFGKLAPFDIHQPKDPFTVPVAVTCDPHSPRGRAELTVTPPGGQAGAPTPTDNDLWLLELEPNSAPYVFDVHFTAGGIADAKLVRDVDTDHRDITIGVTP